MSVVAMRFFYRRLGGRYPLAFLAVELQTALLIVAGTLALFTFYYEGSGGEYWTVLGIAPLDAVSCDAAERAAKSA